MFIMLKYTRIRHFGRYDVHRNNVRDNSKQDNVRVRIDVTQERVLATTVAAEKQYVLLILSVVVALGFQHAMRLRHTVICGLPTSTLFFPHYLINGKSIYKYLFTSTHNQVEVTRA